MRGRKWCFHLDSLTLTLSRREREFSCPTPKFEPNSIGLLPEGEGTQRLTRTDNAEHNYLPAQEENTPPKTAAIVTSAPS